MDDARRVRRVAPVSGVPLRWRLRRGLKELDVVFERYYARRYPSAPPAERDGLEALLDEEDPVLLQWLLQPDLAPPRFHALLDELRRDA
ncbi:MAG TPA: succinate dehydrogenase assembly factor 2 [Candidatus Binatia bacterium]|nr:succinate dehydrogenase assembly factor 2 [Candidatus Binatia bacterium]